MNAKIRILVATIYLLLSYNIYPQSSPEDICGIDDRESSNYNAVGRIWEDDDVLGNHRAVGTAFIIANGKLITAGHIAGSISTSAQSTHYFVEFNNFDEEDRYEIDKSLINNLTYKNAGPLSGNDWAVIEVNENAITGSMPKDAQDAYLNIMQGVE